VTLHVLGGSRPEVSAALHLAEVASVMISGVADCDVGRLVDEGFFETPAAIDCRVALPVDANAKGRRWHRNVTVSMAAWHEIGLELEMTTVGAVGLEYVLDRVYFPLFVPNFYANGRSPYGAHNVNTFRQLAVDTAYLGLIRRPGGGLVAAAVLRHQRAHGNVAAQVGATAGGDVVEGLIYVVQPEVAACRRALVLHLCGAFASLHYGALSLGTDVPFVDGRYVPVLAEKLRWADEVVAVAGDDGATLVFLHDDDMKKGAGAAVLALGECDLVARGSHPAVDTLAARLRPHRRRSLP
jgi:hypothetical protein